MRHKLNQIKIVKTKDKKLILIKKMFKRLFYTFTTSSSPIRTKLIQTSLQYVPKYGWNIKPIHVACTLLDLSPAAHKIISPFDMIAHSMKKWNQQSLRIMDDTNFGNKKRVTQKIQFAIKTRLQRQIPFLDTWAEAMAIGAHPDNISKTKDLLWDYSSEVWYRCGDKSTDYNHYSKRILFNSAYAATELFMLTDKSTDYFATWEFLRRRLDNIVETGKFVSDLTTVMSHAGEGVLSLLTMFKTPQKFDNPIQKYQNELKSHQNIQSNNNQSINKPQQIVKLKSSQNSQKISLTQ